MCAATVSTPNDSPRQSPVQSLTRDRRVSGHNGAPHNPQLAKYIAQCEPASIIDLSRQKLHDEDMDIVVQQAIIEKNCIGLTLWGNKITAQGVAILADALQNNKMLRELDLSYNCLSDKGVEYLSRVLTTNNLALRELDLGSNGITDEGAQHLADMLKTNVTLTVLVLDKNELSDKGMELLANVLAQDNRHLKRLNIEWNMKVTELGISMFIDYLKDKDNRSFEDLYVRNCDVHKVKTEHLQRMAYKKVQFNVIV